MEAKVNYSDDDPTDEDLVFAEIKGLSDYEISWVLLSILLRSHSPTGVSLGRSMRNVLLQHIVNLLDRPQLNIEALETKESAVLVASWDRISRYKKKFPPQQMLLPFYEPQYLDNSILAEILLVNLKQWYQDDAVKERYSLMSEMQLLHPAFILISLNEGIYLDSRCWQIDPQSIIKETKEREFRLWWETDNMDYWHRHNLI